MAELAGRGATWGSVLSVDAFAAIRSVGFEPVGQIFGAAVYPLAATEAVSCPGWKDRIQQRGHTDQRMLI